MQTMDVFGIFLAIGDVKPSSVQSWLLKSLYPQIPHVYGPAFPRSTWLDLGGWGCGRVGGGRGGKAKGECQLTQYRLSGLFVDVDC